MKYIHRVQYYETDKMGFVHHSNFIRWFEEARIDFLEKAGLPYDEMEAGGILSPVVHVECGYAKPVYFGETVTVDIRLTELGSVKFFFEYTVTNAETGERKATGKSSHCFINSLGRPVSLKKERPEQFERLRAAMEA